VHGRIRFGNNTAQAAAMTEATTLANNWDGEDISVLETVASVDPAAKAYFPGDISQRLPNESGTDGDK
jgi:predicted YcjX-like family ATPase